LCPKAQLKKFRKDLFYSQKLSVDAFIENRMEYLDVGKILIAINLIPFENENNLFQISNTHENSYRYIFNKITAIPDQLQERKLAIITFNYDRSLEHFFYKSFKYSYDLTKNQCSRLLINLPIIHVYGQLGVLPWQEGESRPYSPSIKYDNIRIAKDGITIFTEANHDESHFANAIELLKNSDQVYFLGFGYNLMNLRRIGCRLMRHQLQMSGTGFGLGESEIKDIAARTSIKVQHGNINSINFLKDHAQF